MDEPLRSLDELGEQFERVARAAPTPRRRARRLLALAIPAALLVTAAAAAAGLLTGEPVRNPAGVTFRADTGLGTPLPGGGRLLGLRVADPDGGPPWGMRTVSTTRGLRCVQIGRIVGGRLGVLGQDGAFGDDGRFHELPADVLTQAHCQQPDHAGHLFIAISFAGLPASAMAGSCRRAAAYPPGMKPPPVPVCAAGHERILYFGLLGPRATSITYDDDAGTLATRRVSRPQGGYLVVLRPTPAHPASGGFVPGVTPSSGLSSVRYDGAPRCVIRSPARLGGARACPLVGYVAPPAEHVTSAQVGTRVSGSFASHAVRPRTRDVRPGFRIPRQWKLTVVFRARRAAKAPARYSVLIELPGNGGCNTSASTAPIVHDVRAGELVRHTVYLSATCHGSVRGTVTYRPRPTRPEPLPFSGLSGGVLVGRFTARMPG
jgi:hypothetical protein